MINVHLVGEGKPEEEGGTCREIVEVEEEENLRVEGEIDDDNLATETCICGSPHAAIINWGHKDHDGWELTNYAACEDLMAALNAQDFKYEIVRMLR